MQRLCYPAAPPDKVALRVRCHLRWMIPRLFLRLLQVCKGAQGWERRWLVVYKSVVAIFESAGGACIGKYKSTRQSSATARLQQVLPIAL